ncbi:MAG: aldo/keto reductase [Rhodospirillales bacterium]|nr:aldo/keto reductase [Rhodospirillales bacterium]
MTKDLKIGIGTVQFGTPYGIANGGGITPPDEIARILSRADELGDVVLDTAPAYGDSERVLGQALTPGHSFRIVTKTPVFHTRTDITDIGAAVADGLDESLRDLRQNEVHGLLIHHPEDASGPYADELIEALMRLKEQGKVRKIGISVYGDDDLDVVAKTGTFDIVQLPLNVLDRRLIDSGRLDALNGADMEVHARSIFLQGLLLMAPEKLSAYFSPLLPVLQHFRDDADTAGLTPLQAALGFIAGQPAIDDVIIGIDSFDHYQEILSAATDDAELDYTLYGCHDDRMVDPRQWPAI